MEPWHDSLVGWAAVLLALQAFALTRGRLPRIGTSLIAAASVVAMFVVVTVVVPQRAGDANIGAPIIGLELLVSLSLLVVALWQGDATRPASAPPDAGSAWRPPRAAPPSSGRRDHTG
jgi:hypothetical protein